MPAETVDRVFASLLKAVELDRRLGSDAQFLAFAQRLADLLFRDGRFAQAATEARAAVEHVRGEQRAVLELLLAYALLRAGDLLDFRRLWPALDHAYLPRCGSAGLQRLHAQLERLWRENRAEVQDLERLEAQAEAEGFRRRETLVALIALLAPLDSARTCECILRLLALDPADPPHRALFQQTVLRVPDARTRTRLRARLSQLIN